MATSKLFSHLRRSRFPTLSTVRAFHVLLNPNPKPLSSPSHGPHSSFQTRVTPLAPLHLFHCRPFSTGLPDESELINTAVGLSEVPDAENSILPVHALISMLDTYHDLTGLPWWIVIASSTLALRIALLPLIILQLNKIKRIGELFPKLPPPLPPPLSGRSYIDQISLFRKERRAIGCPSFLWFIASFSIQVPCFILGMTSVRRMSLDHHPGFDCGGALWFQNLTELPHGVLAPIFPLLIAGLHYINVQISFGTSSVGKVNDLFGLLAKFYKFYLDFMTLPILFIGFCIPQGSLVYWVTNSSLSVIQQLSLKHPAVRAKLGLPEQGAPRATTNFGETVAPEIPSIESPTKRRKISVQNLSPKELLGLSVLHLSRGQKEQAIPFLRLALDKDPEYVRALIVMGQILLQNGLLAEASEYLERAISKLYLAGNPTKVKDVDLLIQASQWAGAGHPTEVEDVDLLILASQWAGVACIRQGKTAEGILHFERVANIKEPEDPKSKAHYFDGLLMLASALSNEGRKSEAVKYIRLAAAYDPAYNKYLEQCENDEDNFVSDLVNSRRADY